jgi:hypothetical protein
MPSHRCRVVAIVTATALALAATGRLHTAAIRATEAAAARAAAQPVAEPSLVISDPALWAAQVAPTGSTMQRAHRIGQQQRQPTPSQLLDDDGGSARPPVDLHSLPTMPRDRIVARPVRREVQLDASSQEAGLRPLRGLWSPVAAAGALRGIVIAVGGTSAGLAGPCRSGHRVSDREHGLYNALAAVLPETEGVSVLQFSYRTHGWRGIEQSRRDMVAALTWVSSQLQGDDVPIGLIGHSMGAAVVLPPESARETLQPVPAVSAVATLAGVSRDITASIASSMELLVLHSDLGDTNVPVAAARRIYDRHSGDGTGHKRLRYVHIEPPSLNTLESLPAAASHNFEIADGCAKVVWPEILSWVRRWRHPGAEE